MVLYVNVLILNPDEVVLYQAEKLGLSNLAGSVAKNVVDHDTLTQQVAQVILKTPTGVPHVIQSNSARGRRLC